MTLPAQLSEIESIYLTRREAADYLKRRYRQGSKHHLDLLAMTPGAGPKYVKNGQRALYTVEDLDIWITGRLTPAA
jgi:hypothetical protein